MTFAVEGMKSTGPSVGAFSRLQDGEANAAKTANPSATRRHLSFVLQGIFPPVVLFYQYYQRFRSRAAKMICPR